MRVCARVHVCILTHARTHARISLVMKINNSSLEVIIYRPKYIYVCFIIQMQRAFVMKDEHCQVRIGTNNAMFLQFETRHVLFPIEPIYRNLDLT